jgi:hypothetical protein
VRRVKTISPGERGTAGAGRQWFVAANEPPTTAKQRKTNHAGQMKSDEAVEGVGTANQGQKGPPRSFKTGRE